MADEFEMTSDIDNARAEREREHDDATVERLANLLRRRFFALGNRTDIDEYFALQDALSPINLAAYTPFVTDIRQELSINERHWVRWQPWLLSMGYQLYHRHRPGWMPSWLDRDAPHKTLHADYNGPGVRILCYPLRPTNRALSGRISLRPYTTRTTNPFS